MKFFIALSTLLANVVLAAPGDKIVADCPILNGGATAPISATIFKSVAGQYFLSTMSSPKGSEDGELINPVRVSENIITVNHLSRRIILKTYEEQGYMKLNSYVGDCKVSEAEMKLIPHPVPQVDAALGPKGRTVISCAVNSPVPAVISLFEYTLHNSKFYRIKQNLESGEILYDLNVEAQFAPAYPGSKQQQIRVKSFKGSLSWNFQQDPFEMKWWGDDHNYGFSGLCQVHP